MRRHDYFSKQARTYAQFRPAYPAVLYDAIFSHLDNKDTAWDCATGSGQVAYYLANHFNKVCASDISKQQLSYAPKLNNIEYAVAPAEQTPYPSSFFDLITVAQAIHWLDFDQFYKEVNRTGKDKAVLAVIGYGMLRINKGTDPILDELYNYAFGSYFTENRQYIEDRYQTIPFPFKEISCSGFNISYQWGLRELEGYVNSWSAIQKLKEETGANPAAEFIHKLTAEGLWEAEDLKEVTFPIFMRMGRVQK